MTGTLFYLDSRLSGANFRCFFSLTLPPGPVRGIQRLRPHGADRAHLLADLPAAALGVGFIHVLLALIVITLQVIHLARHWKWVTATAGRVLGLGASRTAG